jgi:putative transposase
MKAYSLDLRERVVSTYESEQTTIKEVAKRFSVGETFVKKMLKHKRARGVVEAPRHGGGKPRILDEKHLRALRQWLKKEPDLTLRELQEKLFSEKRKAISVAALGATLQRERLTRKKSRSSRPNEITENEPVIGDASSA